MNKWNQCYSSKESSDIQPVRVLSEFAHLLPPRGSALDYASGLGGNAVFLAKHGLEVSAWDLSAVALSCLQGEAKRRGFKIHTQSVDLEQDAFCPSQTFDVIVISYYLYRPAFPFILDSLNPGGLLYYQTFTKECVDSSGPSNPVFRLCKNELLTLCSSLQLVVYREEGQLGDWHQGLRNEAYYVGRKPAAKD